jgi:hypothetical protein
MFISVPLIVSRNGGYNAIAIITMAKSKRINFCFVFMPICPYNEKEKYESPRIHETMIKTVVELILWQWSAMEIASELICLVGIFERLDKLLNY